MNSQPSPQQVVFMLGTALVIGGVLVMVVFLLIRAIRQDRKEIGMPLAPLRAQDESTFVIASLQGLVAKLRAREKELENQLREAEQSAEVSARTLEIALRSSPQGLVIFDSAGILNIANQAAKNMLNVDTWSRRQYSDLFSADSALSAAMRETLENSKVAKQSRVKYASPASAGREFDVSLVPFHSRGGQLAGIVCIFVLIPQRETR